MTKKPRDYKKEYREYHGKPEQIKRRAQRVQARRDAEADGKVRKGDGREVHHVDAKRTGPLNNKKTKVVSRKENRSIQPKRK